MEKLGREQETQEESLANDDERSGEFVAGGPPPIERQAEEKPTPLLSGADRTSGGNDSISECVASRIPGDDDDNARCNDQQENPEPPSPQPQQQQQQQQSAQENHHHHHKNDYDDIVQQKFHSIPAHTRMGATSSVRQRLNGSETNLSHSSQEDDIHHRKFAAIPMHEEAGLGHWGEQQQHHQQGSFNSGHQSASHLSNTGTTTSQPGAFLVSESSSSPQQQGRGGCSVVGGGRGGVHMVQQQTLPTSCCTKLGRANFNHDNSQGFSGQLNHPHHHLEQIGTDTMPTGSSPSPNNSTNPQPTSASAGRNNNRGGEGGGGGLVTDYSQQRPPSVEADEEEVTPPMLVAELVEPPVEAVQVIFDEGNDQLRMDPSSSRIRQHAAQQQNHNTPNHNSMTRLDGGSHHNEIHKSNRKLGFVMLCFLVVVLCVGIPLAVSVNDERTQDEAAGAVSGTETTPIVYPYECFTSTSDIVQAQMDQPTTNQFILCPNTRIKIGEISNPTSNDTRIIDGDLPLMVVRDNIQILCGLNGSSSDRCVLEGGIAQVLMQSRLPTTQPDQFYDSASNHNVSFRGITFTGSLSNDYTLSSGSVIASNAGKNISFIDCKWENMTALAGVVFEGNNLYQHIAKTGLLDQHSTELIFQDCSFRNIVYDRTFFGIEDQSLTMRGCRFHDIKLPRLVSFCTDHGIGLAAVVAAGHRAKVTLSGTNSIVGLHNRLSGEEQYQQKSCDSGFSRYWEEDMGAGFGSVCISQQTLNSLWTSTTTCTLDAAELEKEKADLNPPMPPTTYDYECYTSTFLTSMAQIEDPENSLLVLCPNTTIRVGRLGSHAAGDWDILDGDFPLVVVRSNIEVRCGLDGSVKNNCVLDGGIVQLIMSPRYPNGMESDRTDNVTIRGITFTGIITAEGTFSSGSVIASNPGRNIQFVDCLWENISAPQDLVLVGSNNYQVLNEDDDLLEGQVVDLTIVNSTFRNIVYAGSLLTSWKQNLTVSRTRFESIQLSPFFGRCGVPWLDFFGWCQTMAGCFDGGSCSLQDICVEGLEYASQAPIMLASPDSKVRLSGFHYVNGTNQIQQGSLSESCSSGLGWVDGTGQEACVLEEDNMTLNIVSLCLLD